MNHRTRTVRACLPILGLLVALLTTCSPATTAPSTTTSPLATSPLATPTEVPTAAATPDATAGAPSLTVTLDDHGQTIVLHTGDRFLLKLGEEYDWNVTIDNESVLARVVGITVVRGAQGVYEAKQAGTATLTADGDPPCRKAKPPCGAPSRHFEVTFTVQ